MDKISKKEIAKTKKKNFFRKKSTLLKIDVCVPIRPLMKWGAVILLNKKIIAILLRVFMFFLMWKITQFHIFLKIFQYYHHSEADAWPCTGAQKSKKNKITKNHLKTT